MGLTTNKGANDVLLLQPQPTANLAGLRMTGRTESVDVRPSEKRGLFLSSSRLRNGEQKKAGLPAWTGTGEQRGVF